MAGALGAFADLVPEDAAAADDILPTVAGNETGGLRDRDHAVSPKGALGRNQIMPGTARDYGYDPAKLSDPAYNDQASKTILADLNDRYQGNRGAVLAGYNGGPGRGDAYVAAGNDPSVLPKETQDYLAKAGITAAPSQAIENGIPLPNVPQLQEEPEVNPFADLIPGGGDQKPGAGGALGGFADLVPKQQETAPLDSPMSLMNPGDYTNLANGSYFILPDNRIFQKGTAPGGKDAFIGSRPGPINPNAPTPLGSFGRGALRGAVPAAAGVAAFGPGAAAGGAIGALGGPAAPVTVPVGALIGGGLTAFGGATVAEKAQDWILRHIPNRITKMLGLDDEQARADQATNPLSTFAGQLAPNLLAFRPGKIASEIPEGATALQRLMSHPVTARAVPATIMAGQEAGTELLTDGKIDPQKVGIAAAIGAASNKETALGRLLAKPGEKLVSGTAQAAARMAGGREAPQERVEPTFGNEGPTNVPQPDRPALPAPEAARRPDVDIKGQSGENQPETPESRPPAAEPIRDPQTWTQTGWRLPDGTEVGLDDPRAKAPGAEPVTDAGPIESGDKGIENDISAAQATEALKTNIDPLTGEKPKGNAALRQFRAKMQAVIDSEPAAGSDGTNVSHETNPPQEADQDITHARSIVEQARAPAPKDETIFDAIRRHGGISDAGPEGGDLRQIMNGYKNPRFQKKLLNTNGLSPDRMRQALQDEGWFGGPDQASKFGPDAQATGSYPGDDIQDLYDAMDQQARGQNVFHPGGGGHEAAASRAMMDELLGRAGVGAGDSHEAAAAKVAAFLKESRAQESIAEPIEAKIDNEDLAALSGQDREILDRHGYEPGADVGEQPEETGIAGESGARSRPVARRPLRGADRPGEAAGGGELPDDDIPFARRQRGREPEQLGLDHTAPSARQLAASRESAGRGRLKSGAEQRPADEGLFAPKLEQTKDLDFSRRAASEKPFYSALTKHIEDMKQERAPAQQWASIIDNARNKGVKQEEIDWSGVKDWLADQKGPVSKADLLAHLRENEVQLQEVTKGKEKPSPEVEAKAREFAKAGRFKDAWEDLPRTMQNDYIAAAKRELGVPENKTKYAQYTLPGGENYRELLLTLPEKGEPPAEAAMLKKIQDARDANDMVEANRLAAEYSRMRHNNPDAPRYKSGHWDEPNILAHVRFDDRTGPNGEKILHLAEVQSDWHQAGRRRGYNKPDTRDFTELRKRFDETQREQARLEDEFAKVDALDDIAVDHYTSMSDAQREEYRKSPQWLAYQEQRLRRHVLREQLIEARQAHANAESALNRGIGDRGVPDAPFKSTWHELAMKRMLRYAAEHGYDRLSWDTGETSADRYDLGHHIDRIEYEPDENGKFEVVAIGKDGNEVKQVSGEEMSPEQIEQNFGKDIAKKMVDGAGRSMKDERPYRDWMALEGVDLKVGGEGMKGFYDKILPNFMNKYGKKFGAQVERGTIPAPDSTLRDRYYTERNVRDDTVEIRDSRTDTVVDTFPSHAAAKERLRALNNSEAKERTAPVHSIPITDAMREGVMGGQPMFARQTEGRQGHSQVKFQNEAANRENRKAAWETLRKRLDGLGLDDVALNVHDAILDASDDAKVDGFYSPLRKLVAVALDNANGWEHTLDHESIHALRDVGAITDAEWKILTDKAKKEGWADKFKIHEAYGDIGEEKIMEETIAHAFPRWREGTLGNPGNAVQRIMKKVKDFFEAVRNAFRGQGFKSAESIFRDISSGKVGRRGLEESSAELGADEPRFSRPKDGYRVPRPDREEHLSDEVETVLKEGNIDAAKDRPKAMATLAQYVLNRGRAFGFETLASLYADGRPFATTSGKKGAVSLRDPTYQNHLYNPLERVISVHNHPSSRAPSEADIAVLAFPGHAAMTVVGHDGEHHIVTLAAERVDQKWGTQADQLAAAGRIAAMEARAFVDPFFRNRTLLGQEADDLLDHVRMAAMENAGLIHYLGPEKRPSDVVVSHDEIQDAVRRIATRIRVNINSGSSLRPAARQPADVPPGPAGSVQFASSLARILGESGGDGGNAGGAPRAGASAGRSGVPQPGGQQLDLLGPAKAHQLRLLEDEPVFSKEERKAKVNRVNELLAEARPLGQKGGLTAAEGRRYSRLMKEVADLRFDLAKPLTVDKVPPAETRMSTLEPESVVAAQRDLMKSRPVYDAITEAAIGVSHDSDTPIDTIMRGKNPDVSPQKFYDTFAATRDALREQYGDTIPLFRAEGQQMDKPTKNWATTREYAEQFGSRIISKDVPVDDVLAVNVGLRGGYHELIVGKPPGDEKAENLSFARRPKPEEKKPLKPEMTMLGKVDQKYGEATNAVNEWISKGVEKFTPDSIQQFGKSLQMAVTPMASGSPEARAAAKDFANASRAAAYVTSKQVEYLKKYDAKTRAAMWEAADEESVLRQQDKEPGPDQGLNRLTPEQRKDIEGLQRENQVVWQQALDVGLVKGEGLPSYMPRMGVAIGADGKHGRLKSGGDGPAGLDRIGRNLKGKPASLKHRKYMTAEETEAAMQAINPGAVLVRDVRALPLAMGRLREAIAGRALINQIREIGNSTNEMTVSEGVDPTNEDSAHKWFTIDHPMMKTYRPMYERQKNGDYVVEGNKLKPLKDEDGNVLLERVPLYVRDDFEGPLRAVLSKDAGKLYKAYMDLKGKSMSVIMYSPMMHNMVIWGKAVPVSPLKMIKPMWKDADGRWHFSIEMYGRGHSARMSPVTMQEAIGNGLAPIGHRFFNQDMTGLLEQDDTKPGRSLTAKVLAYPVSIFHKGAAESVKAGIDTAGDFWHNTLLWDRIADLQMGIYTAMRDKLVAQGHDAQTAGRMAAHFANRYAGAMPQESLSHAARMWANVLLFSRSFNGTNMGAYKDILTGLPRDVQAQILRDKGEEALTKIQGATKRKAAGMMFTDILLSHFSVYAAQAAMLWFLAQQFFPPDENEPNYKDRFYMGQSGDGRQLYGRLPVGKVGEDFQDWISDPIGTGQRKLSGAAAWAQEILSNQDFWGNKIYDPNGAHELEPALKNVATAAERLAEHMTPLAALGGVRDWLMGNGDQKTNTLRTLLPLIGITVSRGAPGGAAMGEYYHARDEYNFRFQQALPDIKNKVKAGDIQGAVKEMTDLGVPRAVQKSIIRGQNAPGMTRGKMRMFQQYSSPEEKAAMDRAMQRDRENRERARAPKNQHSELDGGLQGALTGGTLAQYAASGAKWNRSDAIRAAQGAGLPAVAALLRDARDPVRPNLSGAGATGVG